jgi:hypothetical protein
MPIKDHYREGREIDSQGRIGGPAKAKVEFTPPQGVKLEGDEGEALIKWKKSDGGNVCIVAVDGKPMPGYSDKEAAEKPGDEEAEPAPDDEGGGPGEMMMAGEGDGGVPEFGA